MISKKKQMKGKTPSKTKKRILILNYEFPPLGGGGGVAAKKLAKGFIQLGYEVDYLTTWFKGLKFQEKVEGINVHRVKVIGRKELPTATMISMLTFPLMAKKKACELCEKYDYEFVLSYFTVPSGTLGKVISKKYSLKHFVNIVGGDIYDPTKKLSPHKNLVFRKEVERVLNSADFIASISTDTISRCKTHYSFNKKMVPIAIPYEPFKFKKTSRENLGLKNNLIYTISTGRLVKRKGFDFLIKSLAKVKNKNVHSLIIGEGPEKDNLIQLAKKLKVSDRVHFLGFISEEKKFQYLSNADIYVLSSVHEGFGIVLQEAMQVGLPIISTNNGGQVDFVKNNENGFLIKFGNEKAMVDSIAKILKQKDKFRKANIMKSKDFSLKKIAREYLEVRG